MALDSMQEIFEKAAAGQIPFWQVVLETDMEQRQVTAEQSMEKMRVTWQAMLESVTAYQGTERSRSGLVGGDGEKMRQYVESGKGLLDLGRGSGPLDHTLGGVGVENWMHGVPDAVHK